MADSPATEVGVATGIRIDEEGLHSSGEGKEGSTHLEEQQPTIGGLFHSSAAGSAKGAADKAKSAVTPARPSPADSLMEVIPLFTRLEAGGAWVEALEQMDKSLRGFFSKVPFFSLTYLFPTFSFLTCLIFVIAGDRNGTSVPWHNWPSAKLVERGERAPEG